MSGDENRDKLRDLIEEIRILRPDAYPVVAAVLPNLVRPGGDK